MNSKSIFQNVIIITILCNFFIVGGCTLQLSKWDIGKDVEKEQAQGDPFFGYIATPIDIVTELTESEKHYDLIRIQFPSYFQDDPENKEVVCWHYRQKGAQPKAGILVLPILGGDYGPSKIVSEYLANRGFDVLRFERKSIIFNSKTGLEGTRKVFIRTIVDVRRGIDWWLRQPNVNKETLGVCGISMGGLQASILMGVDRRIKAGVICLNGGDIATLLMVTKEGELVDFRNDLMRTNGWNEEKLLQEAKRQLGDIDPLRFASNIDPKKVLQITARYDRTVPYDFASKWYFAAHRPDRIILPSGHYSAVFYFPYILSKTQKHFEQVFIHEVKAQNSED